MQPSLLMQREKESKSGSEAIPGYTTIDDAICIAKVLLAHLSQLGEYKHPFDVRRGRKEVVKMVEREENSQTLKAGAKTYFLDIRATKGGKPYLMITESRFKGEGEERERSTIIVFQENAQEFAEAVSQMTEKLE
jgi:hypothetical protein